ncbi:MAG TPA: hypothetical protein VF026_03460 [Ktedonobacteraceae bacterium]
MGCHWRHRRVPGRQPCKGSVDLNLLKFSGEGSEELHRPSPGCTQPLRELLRSGWSVRMQIAPHESSEGGLSIGRPVSGQPPARIGVCDLAAAVRAETQRAPVSRRGEGLAPPGPHSAKCRHDQVCGPGSAASDDRLAQLIDGQLGIVQRNRHRLNDSLGLLGRQPHVFCLTSARRRNRGQRPGPHGQVLRGQEMHSAAWPERLDEAALGPQGLPYSCACDTGEPQSDGQLSGGQYLGVRAAYGADDIGRPGIL